jgi:hypothetical protein
MKQLLKKKNREVYEMHIKFQPENEQARDCLEEYKLLER